MTEGHPQLILASASPRRREILAGLGLNFEIQPADVDERQLAGELPDDYVRRLSLSKAQAVSTEDHVVLGADTAVVLDQQVLGKPRGQADAMRMLTTLSGRTHRVLSAVALVSAHRHSIRLSVSQVWFREISESEKRAYWDSGEPADKAGAYGIQGIGAVFVQRLEGSFSGVVGLPIFETAELLQEFGIVVPAR